MRLRYGAPFLSLTVAVLFCVAATVSVLLVTGTGSRGTASDEQIALGAFTSGAPEFTAGAPWDPGKIDEFAEKVGTPPAVVMWYQSWYHKGIREFDPAKMDAVVERGAMPMVTWEPWDHSKGREQSRYELREIADGKYDRFVRRWARDAAEWERPMYLRFAHEMNGTWYPWSTGVNGNTSEDYVDAWRHLHDIFRQEGAVNVRWVWSPVVAYEGTTPFRELYPGDAYVDWVGLGGHNFGTSQDWSSWLTLAELFGPSYDEIEKLAPDKPFMISEVSSSEAGGDKAEWIRSAFNTEIPTRLPETRAVIWYDKDRATNWRIDSSPAALEAFSEVAASPRYKGRLP